MDTRAVPVWVRGYVGLPYAPGGRDHAGVDCWGLLALVWREQRGIEPPAYSGPDWTGRGSTGPVSAAAEEFAAAFSQVPGGDERLFDGVLLRMMARPLHVGLVVAPGLMLHAEEGVGSCLEDYRSSRWARRVLGFYRHEDSTHG